MRIYAKNTNSMKINRPVYLQKLIDRRNNGMIKIITGMRRSGKSYLLFNLFAARLEDEGIDKNHIIAIDLEDIYNEQLREPLPLLQHIDRQVKEDGTYYVLIDEVQLLDRFEEVLNTLLKRPNMDVYVTGSNARFLSKDVITTFRGRGDEVRVHPLSFGEYLSAQADSGFVERHLNDYMRLGGLPQTLTMQNEQQKRDYLQQLFKNTYLLDIKERYDIRNDDDLEELIDIVASGIGGLTNPTKITNTFKSVKQSTIARDTVKNYLDYMQDAFLIEKAVRYDIKGKKYIDTPVKYYFDDLGLRNARLNFRQTEPAHLMENMLYNELRLRGYSVDVGQVTMNVKNEKGRSERRQLEVDFVCNQGDKRIYIQSALMMDNEAKLNQEFASLRRIDDSFRKVVIAGGMQPTYLTDEGILIMNIYDFLLGKTDGTIDN